MKRNLSGAAALFLATLTLLAGCSSSSAADEDELDTIRMGVMTGTIPAYVEAFEEEYGFFADQGIQLEISEFAAGINTVDSVTVEELDIGYVAYFAIINRLGAAEESSLRLFTTAGVAVSSTTALYVNTERIETLSDLEGGNMITNVGTVYDYWNARILEEAGVDADTVTMLPIDGNIEGVAAMQSGQADSMWASGETALNLMDIDGVEAIATVQDIDAYTVSMLVANDVFLQENEDLTQRFVQAFADYYAHVSGDPEGAAERIANNYSVPEDQILLTINQQLLEPGFLEENVEALEDIYAWALENDLVSYEYDIRDYLDTTALEALYPERVTY